MANVAFNVSYEHEEFRGERGLLFLKNTRTRLISKISGAVFRGRP